MIKNRKVMANKIIQTREIKDNCMSFGSISNLMLDPSDVDSNKDKCEIKTAPYYFIGETNGISYFILAEVVDERQLLQWKKQIEGSSFVPQDYGLLQFRNFKSINH